VVLSTPSKILQIELIDEKKEPFASIGKNSQKRISAAAD
jgi:hypothetical protein